MYDDRNGSRVVLAAQEDALVGARLVGETPCAPLVVRTADDYVALRRGRSHHVERPLMREHGVEIDGIAPPRPVFPSRTPVRRAVEIDVPVDAYAAARRQITAVGEDQQVGIGDVRLAQLPDLRDDGSGDGCRAGDAEVFGEEQAGRSLLLRREFQPAAGGVVTSAVESVAGLVDEESLAGGEPLRRVGADAGECQQQVAGFRSPHRLGTPELPQADGVGHPFEPCGEALAEAVAFVLGEDLRAGQGLADVDQPSPDLDALLPTRRGRKGLRLPCEEEQEQRDEQSDSAHGDQRFRKLVTRRKLRMLASCWR